MEEKEIGKPWEVKSLISVGILAAVLLVFWWLFPAQIKGLHPQVLEQAGTGTETFEEYISGVPLAEVQDLLNASRLRIEAAQQEDDMLPKLTNSSVLDDLVDPKKRSAAKSLLSLQGPACIELLHLARNTAANYETTLILVTKLQAYGKLPPILREAIINNDPDKYAEKAQKEVREIRLKRILHAFFILGNRLSYDQLVELIPHVQDQTTLTDLAKIAKHQTMVPAFDLFDNLADTNSTNALTREELDGLSAIGEPALFKKFDTNSTGISKGTLTLDEWVNIGHIPLQYTDFPATYAACVWSDNPRAVTQYLMHHGRRGDRFLQKALNHGKGALTLVLEKQHPISSVQTPALSVVKRFCHKNPGIAVAVKYLILCLGCVLVYIVWKKEAIRRSPALSQGGHRKYSRVAMVLALSITLMAVSEPVLFTQAFSSEYQVAINLPKVPDDPTKPQLNTNTMLANADSSNTLSIIFIVIFAAIQGFVYYTCITKIGEVKNGAGDPKLKLRLLENEDNLFDMGLYIGIAGTALMLAILIIFPNSGLSVSAAYASNIFGILCVAVVKIFHVRQTREALLLEAEMASGDASPKT